MWKSIKQELRVQRGVLIWEPAVTGIAWFFGVIIMLAIQWFDGEATSYFCLGTILALLVGAMVAIIIGVTVVYQGFDDAVHMGKTRKRFLPSAAILIFIGALEVFVITAILSRAEFALYGALFPNMEWEAGPEAFLTPAWIVCYACGVTGLACCFGGLSKANRRVGGIISLAAWITMCWSMNGFDDEKDFEGFMGAFTWLGYTVKVWFVALPIWMRMGIFVLVGIVGYALMYAMLYRKATD